MHRALGYATREAYARERLGMDPTRARSLVRLERASEQNPAFARAYREGALSRVKAGVLAPLVSLDPLGWFVGDWVSWADRVTVRRLREDVDQAVALAETDPLVFRQGGGLPAEARDDRAIGAKRDRPEESPATADPAAGITGPEADDEAGGPDRAIGAKRGVPARTAGSASSAPPTSSSCSTRSCAPFAGAWSGSRGGFPRQARPWG